MCYSGPLNVNKVTWLCWTKSANLRTNVHIPVWYLLLAHSLRGYSIGSLLGVMTSDLFRSKSNLF